MLSLAAWGICTGLAALVRCASGQRLRLRSSADIAIFTVQVVAGSPDWMGPDHDQHPQEVPMLHCTEGMHALLSMPKFCQAQYDDAVARPAGQPIKPSANRHAMGHAKPAQQLQYHVEACQGAFARLVEASEVTGKHDAMYCQSRRLLCDSHQLAASVLPGQAAAVEQARAQQCHNALQRLAECPS